MRILLFLLRKEFLQIFRDKLIIRMIFIMPVMQLLILPNAANFEMKNILLSIVDHDHSEYSKKLIDKITASGYFKLVNSSQSYDEALKQIEQDKADLIIEIPANFEVDLIKENQSNLMISANAINGQTAGLAISYSNSIIREFNSLIRTDWIVQPRLNPLPTIEITSSNWFNPKMNYKFFIVPGVLGLLVTLVGFILTALNIVKEKE